MEEVLGKLKFKCRVTKDTAYGRQADYGEVENTMTLIANDKEMMIKWIVGDEKEPIDEAEIGITTVGHRVTDYDGVFEMPKEGIQLLKQCGFNTSGIE